VRSNGKHYTGGARSEKRLRVTSTSLSFRSRQGKVWDRKRCGNGVSGDHDIYGSNPGSIMVLQLFADEGIWSI